MTLTVSSRDAAEAILRELTCGKARCPCVRAARLGRGLTHCVVHADPSPSMNVTLKGDSLLVHCHGSCSQPQVVEALRERNLWPEVAKYAVKEELANYQYRGADGNLLYETVRYFPKDFRQRRPKPGGGYEWNLDGVPRVLYRLPELMRADPKTTRFIVEGEKDVDRLWAMDLIATCNVGGAGNWRPEYNQYFRDSPVVLVIDNDESGHKHGHGVANHLKDIARTIRWLELPGLAEKEDISDWLDNGGTREELIALARAAPQAQETVQAIGTSGDAATLLSPDSVKVVLSGPTGPIEFLFTDMQKTGTRELDTEVSIKLLQPGTVIDAVNTRLNILSSSARDSCRREVQEILDLPKDAAAKLMNRAYDQARRLFLGQDRTLRVKDIMAAGTLQYMVRELLLQERPTILFGPGGSLKTYVTMSLLLAIARGADWLGRMVMKRNVLLIDYETGPGTTKLRLKRLSDALGLDDVPDNVWTFDADGLPLEDLVEPLKRSIDRNEIGFIALDHCAAAAGTEPEKSDSALRFYRALKKLKTPSALIAHVTGDVASNPELAKRPFGSIFWDNGAGLTWFMSKEEQDEGSSSATIGIFQKKFNDTGRLRDFSVTVSFDGDSGPIDVESADLRSSVQLNAMRGQQHTVYQALNMPMTPVQIKDVTGIGESTLRSIFRRYPGMFERVTESRGGRANLWQRTAPSGPRATVANNRGLYIENTATVGGSTPPTNNRVTDTVEPWHSATVDPWDSEEHSVEISEQSTNGHIDLPDGTSIPW